jgi:hypothetical protein
MSTQPRYPADLPHPAHGPASITVEREPGIVERMRSRHAARKQARLISARNRRVIANWLRRTANRAPRPRPLTRIPEPLLHYRIAAVRRDLLEIAATLEQANNPDPGCVAALHDLLANACDSPLYNADIHISELHATLDYARRGL